nr:hypothetical protein [Tanacetum cinerariifolium]
MLEKKFQDLYKEGSNFVKESEDVMMVNDTHISVHKKHTFIIKMNLQTLDDNDAVDMNGTMDNLEDMISNLERVFAYLKNKKMVERKENKPNKGTPSSNDTPMRTLQNLKLHLNQKVPPPSQKRKIPNLDPPVSFFVNHRRRLFKCDFMSLDPRLELRKFDMENSFTLGSAEELDNVKILQSCNETGNWSPCRDRSIYYNFAHFNSSIYWDAFHWLESENRQLTLYKLNIEDHDHPIITTIEIPYGLHHGRNFLQSFGGSIGSDTPVLVQIYIPGILHLQGRLFESRGCLLLVCRDDTGSSEFTIYEMTKGCSVWAVRLNSKNSTMDHSFGSAEEGYHVRMLQS